MTWITPAANREGTLGHHAHLAEHFSAFYQQFWQLPQIPAITLELCRLRLAQLHSSDTEWQRIEVSVSPEQRNSLQQWPTAGCFNSAEQACLAFTEVYAMDVQSISDELADAVKLHYQDAGLVALIEALGVFDGMTRMSLMWELPVENAASQSATKGEG